MTFGIPPKLASLPSPSLVQAAIKRLSSSSSTSLDKPIPFHVTNAGGTLARPVRPSNDPVMWNFLQATPGMRSPLDPGQPPLPSSPPPSPTSRTAGHAATWTLLASSPGSQRPSVSQAPALRNAALSATLRDLVLTGQRVWNAHAASGNPLPINVTNVSRTAARLPHQSTLPPPPPGRPVDASVSAAGAGILDRIASIRSAWHSKVQLAAESPSENTTAGQLPARRSADDAVARIRAEVQTVRTRDAEIKRMHT